MCGIAGVINFGGAAEVDETQAMLGLLEHRGPDSRGVFVNGGCVIGQTRLAVIDLVTGDPPLSDESGRIGAVLNGEIYNFRDLRKSLGVSGHRFTSAGDTEVLAHLAEDFEPSALAGELHGMFAFAIWDGVRKRLLLGRDRLGKKPLYLWHGDNRLVFGSEIKAVLAHPHVPREFATEMLPHYLTFGAAPTPNTMYKGIRSLRPGHVLVVEEEGGVQEIRYWQRPATRSWAEQRKMTLDEAAQALVRELGAAVGDRLVADVPLGAFLSGGIDSSLVTSLMVEHSAKQVHTFTIGFEDEAFDERDAARTVATALGTEHTEFVVRPDAAALVDRLVWHYDEPFGDSSALPTFLLSELARPHVTVALCGDGGDELFGGYERFAASLAAQRLQMLPGPVRAAALSATRLAPVQRVRRFASGAHLGVPLALLSWVRYIPAATRDQLLGGQNRTPEEWYLRVWAESAGAPTLERVLDLNMATYLLDDLLPKVDRMSMAHGLEVRSPFLDDRLVEFAATIPQSAKVRGLSLKRVLRHAGKGRIPDSILKRRKQGFGVPLGRWFRDDLRGLVESSLGAPSAKVRNWVQGDVIDGLLREHWSGTMDHGHVLWTLLTLELFLRRNGW